MPNTSETLSHELITSLHHQPLLVVLRAEQPRQLRPTIARLQRLGVRHVELAWSNHPEWSKQCRELLLEFESICFGAASLCDSRGLEAVVDAGLRFAVSPVLDAELVRRSQAMELVLVPGVMTPSEVHQARSLGCAMVKLFPAAAVGPHYWRRLAGPLGPLPFCIAAGGLGPLDLPQWLAAGVNAVAIGGSLGVDHAGSNAWLQLEQWLQG